MFTVVQDISVHVSPWQESVTSPDLCNAGRPESENTFWRVVCLQLFFKASNEIEAYTYI